MILASFVQPLWNNLSKVSLLIRNEDLNLENTFSVLRMRLNLISIRSTHLSRDSYSEFISVIKDRVKFKLSAFTPLELTRMIIFDYLESLTSFYSAHAILFSSSFLNSLYSIFAKERKVDLRNDYFGRVGYFLAGH